ncbi:DUF6461 domain-containing protein [Streptomyces zaomyceticus]|uniref:DUF6461 domain-containing protein n=1 Tax=Streptomyces zaomyceticus TaxID=68286 RepID=UPI0039907E31
MVGGGGCPGGCVRGAWQDPRHDEYGEGPRTGRVPRGGFPLPHTDVRAGPDPCRAAHPHGGGSGDPGAARRRGPAGRPGRGPLGRREPVVTSGVDGSWTWAWEQGGTHGLDERILRIVSAGTEAVVLHFDEKPMYWFKYAAGGEVVVGFHTLQAIGPTGQDPARLDDTMRPLGLVPGHVAPLHSVLALVENAFGIRLRQPAEVGDARWSGRLLPLPN